VKSFPKPLNADQEYDYLIKTMQGNSRAREILIERNLRLVAHIVKKYWPLIAVVVVLLVAVGVFVASKARKPKTIAEELLYTRFLELAEEGQVSTVYYNEDEDYMVFVLNHHIDYNFFKGRCKSACLPYHKIKIHCSKT